MNTLISLIEQYGLGLVFLNVLLEQMGLPLPAYPTLVLTGALLGRASYSLPTLIITAMVAALLADLAWYFAGRRFGRRVMSILCRISLSPDSCVRQTEMIYLRWGPWSLLVAKFIPGFASVASALAGALGTKRSSFILFDSLGAMLWAGSAVLLGSLFSSAVDQLIFVLEQLGKWGVLLLALALSIFVANKWWQRYRFMRSLRMTQISVDELDQLLKAGLAPTIIDVRSSFAQGGGRIPGALLIADNDMSGHTLELRDDAEVIVYCACPNEASAARVARALMDKGYKQVRPLTGGIDAWIAAGHQIEI